MERGWRWRNSTHEEFFLTGHQDSFFMVEMEREMKNVSLSQSMLIAIVKPIFHYSRDLPVYTQDPLPQH